MQTSTLRTAIIRKCLFNRFIKMSTLLTVHFLATTHAMLFSRHISSRLLHELNEFFSHNIEDDNENVLCDNAAGMYVRAPVDLRHNQLQSFKRDDPFPLTYLLAVVVSPVTLSLCLYICFHVIQITNCRSKPTKKLCKKRGIKAQNNLNPNM